MLKQRVLTAALLLPLAVLAVLYLPTTWLGLVLGLPVVLGGWEWARLAGASGVTGRVLYLLLLSLGLLLSWRYAGSSSRAVAGVVAGAAVWWLVALGLIVSYRGSPRSEAGWAVTLRAAAGLVVLIPAWLAVVVLHGVARDGPELVVFVLGLVWLGDIAAYSVGRRFGHRRLIPRVSPGKTREGLWGELAAALIWAAAGSWWFGFVGTASVVAFIAVSLAAVSASVVGDLFVSLIKRGANAKDSGNLLPGHGGILDRIDSLTAALPIFLLGLFLMGAT